MIRTINPYATARTAEIMSRYRPIAPKPTKNSTAENENSGSAVPNGIRKSPFLRNVWAHLRARPTRTWKRGRPAAFGPPPLSVKRRRTNCLQGGLYPSYHVTNSPAKNLAAMHGFTDGLPQISLVPLKCGLDTPATTLADSVVLPLLCCTAAAQLPLINKGNESCAKRGIDLNITADHEGPEELDFLPQLQQPVKPSIISPRPVRPVGSSIIVKRITGDPWTETMLKGPEEVEEDVEAEAVPAIVTDSSNKVRISNSAYKKMVGQPECCWLDCAAGGGGACRRIGGEVSLQFVDSKLQLFMHGFSCRVEIEWESKGKKKCVNASCSAVKLACQAKDYQFLWRFHTSEASKSASDNLNL